MNELKKYHTGFLHGAFTLDENKNYTIICRKEDGYIDVTNLCKAGKRKFNTWNRSKRAKLFINELSAHYCANQLIKIITTGPNNQRGTWVHPKVAINIAQWISPKFDVQVSHWVHELMVRGHASFNSNISDKELLEEMKEKY